MNTTLYRIPALESRGSRRTRMLAAASGLVATASIAITLAVSSGGGDAASSPSAAPSTATPDRATLYQRGAEVPQPAPSVDARRSAERFHHFR